MESERVAVMGLFIPITSMFMWHLLIGPGRNAMTTAVLMTFQKWNGQNFEYWREIWIVTHSTLQEMFRILLNPGHVHGFEQAIVYKDPNHVLDPQPLHESRCSAIIRISMRHINSGQTTKSKYFNPNMDQIGLGAKKQTFHPFPGSTRVGGHKSKHSTPTPDQSGLGGQKPKFYF